MIKPRFIYFCFLFFSVHSFCQKHELGKVTIDELKEKVCPMDTSAVASVLFNVGKTSFEYSGDDGFRIVTEIDTKIKIYKKEGYDFANHSENAYIGTNGSEKISFSKAITYNLVDDKIEKSKLNSDGEFDEKINKNWNRRKIAMPNVKVGSIIEYRIIITSPYVHNFPEWEFQKEIPVNFSEYTTFIPEYFTYNIHTNGHFTPKTEKSFKGRTIDYTYTEDVISGGFQGIPKRIHESRDFQENMVKYTLENLPALKDEGYVNNITNYQTKLMHELAGTKFPDTHFQSYNADWESVVRTIYKREDFGDELKKVGYFEKDLETILKGINSQEEKIATIFSYVKMKMNWNESYGVLCDEGVKKAYQDKKGNVAEINLMLTAMLRYAGFEANPILVSTRSNGISLYPSKDAYNYVIAGIELGNQVVLLDATSKLALPDILPIRDLNWFGRIIRKDESSEIIDLMPKSNSLEVTNIMANIDPQGEVTGKIRDQYFDYNALSYRDKNNGISKEIHIEKLEKKYRGLEIKEFEVLNNLDLSKQIIENYSFTNNNSVEIVGDKLYVSPFLFFATTENPFKQEIREYPIDFVFPKQNKYNITITIPQGYAIETLPQPQAVAMPGGLGNFKYMISANGNQIQLYYVLDINQAIIGSENYDLLKNFYKEIVNKQTEKIVIKKS